MKLVGWERVDGETWRICWGAGDAVLRRFAPFPVGSWRTDRLIERALAEAGASDLGALEPCRAGRLEGVSCRFAVPGASDVDRTLALLHDGRWFYAVSVDRRGAVPTGIVDAAWRQALATLRPATSSGIATVPALAALEHWAA